MQASLGLGPISLRLFAAFRERFYAHRFVCNPARLMQGPLHLLLLPRVKAHGLRSPLPTPRPRRVYLLIRERSAPDRKSTRLNSSHVAISYAVFCLKKKLCVT